MSGTELTPGHHPFYDLRATGLLWLINRVVFHPHGYALAIDCDTDKGEAYGWRLIGNGVEPWDMGDTDEEARQFLAIVKQTLADAAAANVAEWGPDGAPSGNMASEGRDA